MRLRRRLDDNKQRTDQEGSLAVLDAVDDVMSCVIIQRVGRRSSLKVTGMQSEGLDGLAWRWQEHASIYL